MLTTLDQLNAAVSLRSLQIPRGNPLEALGEDRDGQHSMRINDPRARDRNRAQVCGCQPGQALGGDGGQVFTRRSRRASRRPS